MFPPFLFYFLVSFATWKHHFRHHLPSKESWFLGLPGWVRLFVCHHLLFLEPESEHIWTWGWRLGGYPEWISLRTRGLARAKIIPYFTVYFQQNLQMKILKMNIMLCWRILNLVIETINSLGIGLLRWCLMSFLISLHRMRLLFETRRVTLC